MIVIAQQQCTPAEGDLKILTSPWHGLLVESLRAFGRGSTRRETPCLLPGGPTWPN